jgi:hypothetical protein
MELEQYAHLAEIVSSIGVVVSLIYVSVQIRQNTRALNAATYNDVTGNSIAILTPMYADPEVTEFVERVQSDYESATPAEKRRFHAMLLMAFRHWDNLYYQYRTGALEAELWRGYDRTMSSWLSNDAWQAWFRSNAEFFSDGLRALVRQRLQ